MNKRTREVLSQLITKNEYNQSSTIEELANTFHVSSRTIRYDIEQINDYLKKSQVVPLMLDRQGNIFISDSIQKAKSSLEQEGFYAIKLSKEERICFESVILICKCDFVTLGDLAEYLFVSRSTIVQDQSALKQFLKQNKLYLFSYPNRGLLLEGEEIQKRRLLFKMICSYHDIFKQSPVYHHLMEVLNGQELQYIENREIIEKIISSAEQVYGRFLTDVSFYELRVYLELAWFRISQKCYIDTIDNNHEHKHYDMAFAIMQQYGRFITDAVPKEEVLFLDSLLNQIRYIKKDSNTAEIVKLQVVTMTFIENLSLEIGVELQRDYFLYENLINHLQSTFSEIGEVSGNHEIIHEIEIRYSDIKQAAKNNLYVLEEYLDRPVSDSELIYVVIHICAAIERMKSKSAHYSVVLVCGGGIGTARFLQARLEKYFHFDVLDVISAHAIPTFDFSDVDAIISTISLHNYDIDYIQVNPMLSDEDCIKVGEMLSKISPIDIKRKTEAEKTNPIDILKQIRYVLDKEENHSSAITKIQTVINNFFRNNQEMMLYDILKQEAIQINVECTDWKEAIRASAKYLLKNNYITPYYIERMIQNVMENGPYIVFAPGFALAHESLDSGSLKLGMSLIRLKTPVPFGKQEMDPVEWICCLSAIDKETHLKAMFQLMNLLYNQEYRKRLQQSYSEQEIYELIVRFVYES